MAASASHLCLCVPAAFRRAAQLIYSPLHSSLAYVSPTGPSSIADGKHPCSLHFVRNGDIQKLLHSSPTGIQTSSNYTGAVFAMSKPVIQFIKGVDELTVPDVSLTRSRDQTNGVAIFVFDQPSIFDSSRDLGEITGFYMIDEEGTLQSVDVSAKFVNGKPSKIEARFVMRTLREWDRFMRFMERYANQNNLGFVKK
ncbi:hypothetical protein O6H91_12G052300 [Diphasiastrum complanatum]|uniref:Uncharacterized protein n=2 Tax=Diphasiastrum complanatum TaxID=34168 RepID=A0ACC2C1T5_DIPCM|nr:hypothetical protein O6H91_12G052300 [Diphasiastrum complanatum]